MTDKLPKEKQSEWKLIETTPQKEGEDAFHFYEWTPLPKPPIELTNKEKND